jgi:Mn-dependent DtxR family transcriptional regulator
MREQPIPDDLSNQASKYDDLERDVLYLLTDPERYQAIWSVEDIGREMDYSEPTVPVRGLHTAGLIHKTADGFVFATRAAFRLVQIVGQVI